MDMTKGQGAQAEEMTLSALLKMLELSKFLTVETMCEQYLSSHTEEGMAYLVMYAAKVKSATLHKFQKGDSVNCDFQETFPLYIEHRQLLDTFFRHGEHAQVADLLHYMKAYLLDAMKVWETEQELPSSKEDFCDFAWMILNTIYSYDKSDFADLSLAFGKHLLTKRAFEEAKEFFENAKAQGADKAECLLYTLYAAMEITGESEFASCERFRMDMPEYINLIVAIGDNDTLLQKVTTLAEENVKARTKPREQSEREQRETRAQHRPLNKEKVKRTLVFGGPFAFAVITLILIFAWIIPSVRLQGLIFDISDDGEYAIVTGYQGDASELLIPEKYSGLPVKKIAEKAFSKCTNLTSITIPDSVTSIGSYAFRGCTSLTSITIPDSVTSIGDSAFFGCSSLKCITLPFVGGSNNVTSANSNTLFGYIFGTSSYDGGVARKQYYSLSSYETYYIPSTLESVTITGGTLHYGAFYNCTSLTSITIPDSIQKIDNSAFYGCSNLQTVTFGENSQLSSIGSGAFENCSSLTSITIPSSVQKVDYYAFYGCSNLQTVTFGENSQLSSVGASAFRNCTSLTSIDVGSGNENYKSIDGNLYTKDGKTLIQYAIGKKETSFTIPDGVTSIDSGAFYDCSSLTSITIPSSVQKIDYRAFYNCSNLQTVTFGENSQLSSIGSGAFENCSSLTSITIGDSFTSIGSYAFSYCTSLTSVTIPDSVTSIGSYAFYSTSLTSIKYRGTEEQWNAITKGSDWDFFTGNYTITYNYTGE